MKIIAAVDIMEGNVVRLVKGNPANKIIYGNNAIEIAQKWEAEGADLLHVVDLDATLGTGKDNLRLIAEVIKSVQIPVQVAGGIRTVEIVENILSNTKAAKIVLGTLAYRNPELIAKLSRKKLEKIVVSLDQLKGVVMIDGWKEASGKGLVDAINQFLLMGVHEFLLTSVERDGTLEGPDLDTLSHVCTFRGTKIMASGGVSNLMDILRLRVIGCSSVVLGRAIYDGKLTLSRAKALV
ncbi:MAG: 1-(5-phosphoribosyl)-5-[(5-phosphoribosylamino)methylideneamino] imidazole-4-carboxamide isomerase [Thermoproteota archaeon]|nr:1-(5-phosphoribosyl)-5-[(5-phosphoribosylamino)methylideneamino] imidazole-4-carboxamide isomerase [Thermoproteota archaeon]